MAEQPRIQVGSAGAVQQVILLGGTRSPGKTTIADYLSLEAALGVLRPVLRETRITARFVNEIADLEWADR